MAYGPGVYQTRQKIRRGGTTNQWPPGQAFGQLHPLAIAGGATRRTTASTAAPSNFSGLGDDDSAPDITGLDTLDTSITSDIDTTADEPTLNVPTVDLGSEITSIAAPAVNSLDTSSPTVSTSTAVGSVPPSALSSPLSALESLFGGSSTTTTATTTAPASTSWFSEDTLVAGTPNSTILEWGGMAVGIVVLLAVLTKGGGGRRRR